MIKRICFLALILVGLNLTAQDKKFSVEVDYPISVSDHLNKVTGIISGNLTYRFLDSEKFSMGLGYTFDYLQSEYKLYNYEVKNNYLFHHIGVSVRLHSLILKELKPLLGVGYTYLSTKQQQDMYEPIQTDDPILMPNISSTTESVHGYNIKFGLQYDIYKELYLLTYFHFIQVYADTFENKEAINFNQLKIGLGYRF